MSRVKISYSVSASFGAGVLMIIGVVLTLYYP